MAKIIGHGAPTKHTPGILGQEYFDKDSNQTYTCVKVNHKTAYLAGEADAEYEWTAAGGGGPVVFYSHPQYDSTYLYNDLEHVTKTTKDDIINALGKNIIVMEVFDGYVERYCTPLEINSSPYWEHSHVMIIDSADEHNIISLYTEEYETK